MRYFIEFSYLGSAYSGWQSQPEGQGLGVQTVFERALGLLTGHGDTRLTAAGRTDAGVHAAQMFAHFDTPSPIDRPEDLCRRLNAFLPADIAVRRLFPVKDQAHARFDARRRQYKYFIDTRKTPFRPQTAYYYPYGALDVEAMNRACDILLQYEDFQCFSKVHTDVRTFICRVEQAFWEYEPREGRLTFTITADRFLRNMVRAIVGTLLEIGRGRMPAEGMHRVIESRSRSASGTSVPAQGLFLWRVDYPWEDLLPSPGGTCA